MSAPIYRVLYISGSAAGKVTVSFMPGQYQHLPNAEKELRRLKRRGLTAWIERDGIFFPVAGARRKPAT